MSAQHMSFPRRRILLAGAAAACVATAGPAMAATLPAAVSLPEELAQALGQGQPLVVMVSLDGCPFCKMARDHYLAPLRAQQGLAIVQVDMHSRRLLRGFNGKSITHEAAIQAWGVRVAPTLLFFGRDGQEVAERMVGGYIPDFYGAYLEQRLLRARAALAASPR